jgi:hypothetical protein
VLGLGGRAGEPVRPQEPLDLAEHHHVGDPAHAHVDAGLGPGSQPLGLDEHLALAVGRQHRGEDGQEDQQAEHGHPHPGRPPAQGLAEGVAPQSPLGVHGRGQLGGGVLLGERDLLDGHQLTRTLGSRNV